MGTPQACCRPAGWPGRCDPSRATQRVHRVHLAAVFGLNDIRTVSGGNPAISRPLSPLAVPLFSRSDTGCAKATSDIHAGDFGH